MDGGDGEYSNDVASQYYVAALKGLIDAYIEDNGDIDTNRIYVGGCSNGGFMTVNMIFNYSDFFAAAFPICEAYPTGDVSAEKVESVKDMPIWFTHSTNDNTVRIANNGTQQDVYTNALYIDLINAGAENVHYTLFETVNVDGVNYDGHWSQLPILIPPAPTKYRLAVKMLPSGVGSPLSPRHDHIKNDLFNSVITAAVLLR